MYDLLITSNDNSKKLSFENSLKETFKMKDLGEVHFCLCMKIVCNINEGLISIDEKNYIGDKLEKFRMRDCNRLQSPLDPNQDLFVVVDTKEACRSTISRINMKFNVCVANYSTLNRISCKRVKLF